VLDSVPERLIEVVTEPVLDAVNDGENVPETV